MNEEINQFRGTYEIVILGKKENIRDTIKKVMEGLLKLEDDINKSYSTRIHINEVDGILK